MELIFDRPFYLITLKLCLPLSLYSSNLTFMIAPTALHCKIMRQIALQEC